MKTVLLRHPKTNGEWACPVGAVDAWLAKGWEKAEKTEPAVPDADETPAVPAARSTTGKDK